MPSPPTPSLADRFGPSRTAWWRTNADDGRIVCELCPRECHLKPGDRGFCFVRENVAGSMVLSTYGRSTGFCIDPIEKKPLNHFLPGTSVLSFGTAGCNLGCKFCQNWDISKSREVERLSERAEPEQIAAAAQQLGCRSVAFTYNDPVIWAEYAIDTARACRAVGVKTVAVTAGYITPAARGEFYEFMDAANVDLKGFTEEFYWHYTYSHLAPVLETLRWLKAETNVWFEITNLVIPEANDTPDEFRRLCSWILAELGDRVPVHFTAFHPDFRLRDRPRTPHETLLAAHEIALGEGLKYVYTGNVHDVAHQSTYCHACGKTLIERNWYTLGAYNLRGNHCGHCGAEIPGRFEDRPGTWGPRRQPVDISNYASRLRSADALPILVDRLTSNSPPTAPSLMSISPTPAAASAPRGFRISPEQEQAIHALAQRYVVAAVLEGTPEEDPELLRVLAALEVWGAFVTLKRRGRLRGCCGHMGQKLTAIDAVKIAAQRTAVDDVRLPAVHPCELEFLDLDVTLLYGLRPVTGQGAERAQAVVVGQHGLRIERQGAAGLFLPQVAAEHGWDSETFLREVCVKAGLPTTAWLADDTKLWTFAGHAIAGSIELDNSTRQRLQLPPLFSAQQMTQLADHCRRNLLALIEGATATYFLPQGPEGMISGVAISVHDASGAELAQASRVDLVRAVPLQATAFQLLEGLAASLGHERLRGPELAGAQVRVTALTGPAMHGTAAEPDARGFDSARRAALASYNGRLGWTFDPTKSADELLREAAQLVGGENSATASLFGLAAFSSAPAHRGGAAPRARADGAIRPAAVAGTFYPAQASELWPLVDSLLKKVSGTFSGTTRCGAVMVPHAGYRFSGHIAAQTLARVQIPGTVIVLGPKHTPLGVEWAVSPCEAWQLPGCTVRSHRELAEKLVASIPGLALDAEAHRQEHGIEVELPFIARLAPQAQVVGLALGRADLTRCLDFAHGLASVMRTLPERPLLVISSDMNHYASDADTRTLDALALAELERLDAAALYRTAQQHHISMCGLAPAIIVLETLRELGLLHRAERVAYGTSADTSGDKSRCVGYAGYLFPLAE